MPEQYITLMSALPSLGKSYHVVTTPISRYQLDKRLRLLTDEHQSMLNDIESVLHWDHLNSHYDDRELIESAQALITQLSQCHFDAIKDIIVWRLDLRTILAGLRYRAHGEDLDHLKCQWGVGELMAHIESHWQHPHFNLQARFHWIPALLTSLNNKDTIGVERILFDATWERLSRSAASHYFDFTAVVRYVLMWNLVARWSSYDADRGVEQFKTLVDFSLGKFNNLKFDH